MRAARKYIEASRTSAFSETLVLMLYGENESMIEPHAKYFERKFDGCQTAEIPGASHNARVNNPEFIRTQIRTVSNDAFTEQEEPATSQ